MYKISGFSFKLNFALVGIFTLCSKIVNLAILGYPAKLIGPENYGTYGYAVSIVAYMGIFLLPGLSNWAAREVAKDKENLTEIFSQVFSIKLILSILVYISLIIFSHLNSNNPKEFSTNLIYGAIIFPTALNNEWVFNGLQKMRVPAFINFFQSVVALFLILFFVNDQNDLLVYCSIYPVCAFLNLILQFYYLKKMQISFSLPSFYDLITIVKKAYIIGVASSLIIILHYFNNFAINFLLGKKALAIFMVAFFFLEVLATIPTVFATVFQSRLTNQYKVNPKRAILEVKLFSELHIILAFFFAAILFINGPNFIILFFGNEYSNSQLLIKIIAFGIIFNYAIFGYTNSLISFGLDKAFFKVVLLSCFTAIILGVILTHFYGLIGATIGIVLIDVIPFIYSLKFYRSIVGSINFSGWVIPIIGFFFLTFVPSFFGLLSDSIYANILIAALFYFSLVGIRLLKVKKIFDE